MVVILHSLKSSSIFSSVIPSISSDDIILVMQALSNDYNVPLLSGLPELLESISLQLVLVLEIIHLKYLEFRIQINDDLFQLFPLFSDLISVNLQHFQCNRLFSQEQFRWFSKRYLKSVENKLDLL